METKENKSVRCSEECLREQDRQENAPYRPDMLVSPYKKPMRWKPREDESER